jgi:hypothetical protein
MEQLNLRKGFIIHAFGGPPEDGRTRDYKLKPVRSEGEAWKAITKKKEALENDGVESVDAGNVKFLQLGEKYQKARLYKAVIINGKKVGGVKSLQPMLCSLKALTNYFGKTRIQRIRLSHLEEYKQYRLSTPTKYGTQRNIASVNRELELCRAMFRFAIQERWVVISPFNGGGLISKESETKRNRILSDEEEYRLIEAC